MCELLSFTIWMCTPCCFFTSCLWGCSSFTTTLDPCAGIKSQVFLMLNGGYFSLEPNVSRVTFICILLHNPRRKSTKGAPLSGLVTRSTYCRARHETQESSLDKHEWGSNILQYAPGQERNASIYITNDTPLNSHLPTFQLGATAVWRMNYYM